MTSKNSHGNVCIWSWFLLPFFLEVGWAQENLNSERNFNFNPRDNLSQFRGKSWLYRFPPWSEPHNPSPPLLGLPSNGPRFSNLQSSPLPLESSSSEDGSSSLTVDDSNDVTAIRFTLDDVVIGGLPRRENREDSFQSSTSRQGFPFPGRGTSGVELSSFRSLPLLSGRSETSGFFGNFPNQNQDFFSEEVEIEKETRTPRNSNFGSIDPVVRAIPQQLRAPRFFVRPPSHVLTVPSPPSNIIIVPKFPPLPLEKHQPLPRGTLNDVFAFGNGATDHQVFFPTQEVLLREERTVDHSLSPVHENLDLEKELLSVSPRGLNPLISHAEHLETVHPSSIQDIIENQSVNSGRNEANRNLRRPPIPRRERGGRKERLLGDVNGRQGLGPRRNPSQDSTLTWFWPRR